MAFFEIFALLITLTALFSLMNHHFFKRPVTIGVMLISQVVSLALIAVGQFAPGIQEFAIDLTQRIDFNDTLTQGMLSFLLFAGALHVDLSDLRDQKVVIATLAMVGVLISMFVFGTATCSCRRRWAARRSASPSAGSPTGCSGAWTTIRSR